MERFLLKGKIHNAVITGTRLDYEGSVTVDSAVLESAGISAYEMVHVLNLNNGQRAETYAIEGKRGSGTVELNGPAARLGQAGDPVVILAYGLFSAAEKAMPKIAILGPGNRVKRRRRTANGA